jgi:hypothetical protein
MSSDTQQALTPYREPEPPISRYYVSPCRQLFIDLGKIVEMWWRPNNGNWGCRLEGIEEKTMFTPSAGQHLFDALCRYRGVAL